MRTFLAAIAVSAAVVVYAQSPALQRGDIVRVIPDNTSRSASALALQVVAIPGDQLGIEPSGLSVNGQAVAGFTGAFLYRIAQRPELVPAVVPDGHYFVMGEQVSTGNVSEYWGQHAGMRLQRVR